MAKISGSRIILVLSWLVGFSSVAAAMVGLLLNRDTYLSLALLTIGLFVLLATVYDWRAIKRD